MAVLVFSLMTTWRLHQNAYQSAVQTLQTQFDFRSRAISNEIIKRMATYEQVLRGVDGLFAHSDLVERDEFHDYIARLRLKENYPGIQGIRFSPVVPFAEKARHISAVRKQGLPGYSIHPEGKRDFYTPVTYIEPYDELNEVIFGYDTYSDLEHQKPGDITSGPRRAAMEMARDTGSAALSGKIRLLFESSKDTQAGFLMFLPIFRHDAPRNTIKDRRANIIGWISMVFRADDLMKGILGQNEVDVDIDLYDGNTAQDSFLLHDIDNSARQTNILPKAHFESVQQMKIAGRSWTLVTRSLPAFESRLNDEKSRLIATGGVTASLMFSLLTWLLLYDRKRMLHSAAAIERESHKNKMLLQTAADGIYISDINGNLLQVNEALCTMLGYSESELLNMNVAELCASYSKEELTANFAKLGSTNLPFEVRQRRHDGSIIDVEVSASRVKIDGQEVIYNSIRDISGRKQSQQTLAENRSRLHTLFANAMDAVVIIDSKGNITGWNSQAENMFGWARNEAIGLALHLTIIPHQYREAHQHGLYRFLESGKGPLLNSRIEISALHRDGHEFPIELSVTPIRIRDKYEFSAFIRDITKKKQFEDLIWKQANYDALTGLPNRRMLHDRLAQEIKKAHRAGLVMALLFIDLDRFKEINDTLGHRIGDLLLIEAAQRISNCLRETDTVARLGGDEFTVILSEIEDTSNVERIAENILGKLAEPYRLENEVVHLSASIGITLYPHDASEIEDLLKDADQAMYVAKNTGRNRLSYFTPALQQAAITRLKLINDLRTAVSSRQLRVFFQPIVNLVTGQIDKTEALIRWQHPERGMVSPMDFIPLAEETGLIFEIGDWVFNEATTWVKRWRKLYHQDLQVSINKSPVQFYKDDAAHMTWVEHLRNNGLPGECLVIEITEGLLLESHAPVTDVLIGYRDSGIQVAIDDFGTGYSSLAYLKRFDIDYLKIDKSFTSHLEAGSSDMALTEAIIVMAHKLGFKVVAEGVETEHQRNLLALANCDYAQGYLYSKPLPPEKFEQLLKTQHGESSACSAHKIIWDDKYLTGIEFMDAEHAELFDIIENCIQLTAWPNPSKEMQIECLNRMASHLAEHCKHEEEFMHAAKKKQFGRHLAQHQHIIEKLSKAISLFKTDESTTSSQNILQVIYDWFVVHNATEDKELADFIHASDTTQKSSTIL